MPAVAAAGVLAVVVGCAAAVAAAGAGEVVAGTVASAFVSPWVPVAAVVVFAVAGAFVDAVVFLAGVVAIRLLRAGVVVAGAVGAVVVTVGPGTRTTRLTRRTTTSRLTISRFTMTFGAAARAGAAAGGRDPASMTQRDRDGDGREGQAAGDPRGAETARLAGADGADDRLLDRAVGEQEDLEGERPEDAADEQPLAAGRGDVGGPPEQEDARGEAAGEDFRDEARHDSLTCVGHLHASLKTRSPGRVAALDGRSTAGTVVDGPRGHRMRDAR